MGRWLSIRWEQFRQARSIHGGTARFCLAVLGVKLARVPIPSRWLRTKLFRDFYTRAYPPGLNEVEAERPLNEYRSLNAVFTRGLKPAFRPIPADPAGVVSPCDGTVQDVGRVDRGRLVTVKGIEYSLESLLPGVDTRPYDGGQFAIIFLSPIDCHRVFSPHDGFLEEIIHVPGARLLVHPPFQREEFPVYTLNERVVLRLSTESGPSVVVMVAGWGVGNITFPDPPEFRPSGHRITTGSWDTRRAVKRGDWIATFELGSSVILITSSSAEATPVVSPNEKVRYGQAVLKLASACSPL